MRVSTNEVFDTLSQQMRANLAAQGHTFPNAFHLSKDGKVAHTYCMGCRRMLRVTSEGEVQGAALAEACDRTEKC